MQTFRSLAAGLALALFALAPAAARADLYVLDIQTLQPGVPAHYADAYQGALALIARRHGGMRVSDLRALPRPAGSESGRVVGLWRFRDARSLAELKADPAFAALAALRRQVFDPAASQHLELVRAWSVSRQ